MRVTLPSGFVPDLCTTHRQSLECTARREASECRRGEDGSCVVDGCDMHTCTHARTVLERNTIVLELYGEMALLNQFTAALSWFSSTEKERSHCRVRAHKRTRTHTHKR